MNVSQTPFVTIIIPTKNSEKEIRRCLSSITRLNYPGFQAIIVDGHSQDGTVEIAEKHGCKVLYEDAGTRAAAVNIGAKSANGEYIAFTDADAVVDKEWLTNLVKALKDSSIGAAMGRQLIPEDAPPFTKYTIKAWQTILGGGTLHATSGSLPKFVDHPVGVNSIVKKRIFDDVGGLSEDLLTAEDVELGFKIRERGYKIVYVTDAVVWHYRTASPKKHFLHMMKYGYGRAQLFKKCPRTIRPFNFAPAFLVIFLPLFCVLALYDVFLLFAPILYLLMVLSIGLIKGSSIKEKIGISYAIILSHIGYGLGFLNGLLKG